MRKIWKKIVACFAILTIVLSGPIGCSQPKTISDMIVQSTEVLQKELKNEEKNEGNIQPGSPTKDWTEMVCGLAGTGKDSKNYLEELEQSIVRQYAKKGNLSEVKATEYHRAALTILSLGGNPEKVGADGEQINLIADGTWEFPGGSPGLQGANGLIYALLTLDSKDYTTPDAGTRAQYVKELLTYQKDSGAFCIDNSLDGDVDITAMALQALAPYRKEEKAEDAVNRAMKWLEEQEKEGKVTGEEGSAESVAQVILALCALGEDPEQAEAFSTEDHNLLDSLEEYRLKNGMYTHEFNEKKENIMATYQAVLALEAVEKLRNEQQWIFDFTK